MHYNFEKKSTTAEVFRSTKVFEKSFHYSKGFS